MNIDWAYLWLAALLVAGEVWPRQRSDQSPYLRWLRNAALFALCALTFNALHRLLPALPTSGLAWSLHLVDALPLPIAAALIAVLFDFYKYWEHRAFHRFEWLWRAHLVHHSDREFDVTTDLRHHPLEAVATSVLGIATTLLLGASAAAFAIALLAHKLASNFNHANIALPAAVERVLRVVIVTPDFHRVHHSSRRDETDSHYGNLLTLWDHLFGTVRHVRYDDQAALPLGLDAYATPQSQGLLHTLAAPFRQPIH